MSDWVFADPGPCPICGAPHSSCGALPDGAIVIDQLPASTASAALRAATTPLQATIQATLPADHFTTGTYRGTPPRPRKRRA